MPDAAVRDATEAGATARFLTFRVDQHLYALPAQEIAEVIRIPAVAKVPQSPKALLGMANLRGSVLPVASMRGLLGHEGTSDTPSARAIVLDGAAPVALAVDAVHALVALGIAAIETREALLSARPGERLRGAFQTRPSAGAGHDAAQEGVAKILDIQALLAAAFVQRARPNRARSIAVNRIDAPSVGTDGAQQQMLVTFDIAGQEYAIDLDAVREIVTAPAFVAPMPGAEALVLGVAAHRDTLLPILSLRGLLGFAPPTEAGEREKMIITNVAGLPVGLVVDRMRAIVRADPHLIDPTPSVLVARTGGESRIRAIYRGDGGRRLISILATEQLFRQDVMQRLVSHGQPGAVSSVGAPQDRDQSGEGCADEAQFLVFHLGEEEFGLPISAVDEVARVPEQITRLPKTPRFLEGVVNLRGAVLPVVDQRRRFDLPNFTGDHQRRRLIVLRTERHRAGLIVDSVQEVLRVPVSAIEPAPNLTNETARLVHGVLNLDATGRMVLLLDPAELLSRAEQGLLDSFERSAMPEAV
jgi:purine-binding chemotaxis protein CheW